jgi:hypothetical protein
LNASGAAGVTGPTVSTQKSNLKNDITAMLRNIVLLDESLIEEKRNARSGETMEKVQLLKDENHPGQEEYYFYCPGCGYGHAIPVRWNEELKKKMLHSGNPAPTWSFNSSIDNPTFSPSIVYEPSLDKRCHFYIRDGNFEYMTDCWHSLRGRTVEMREPTAKQKHF